MTKSETEKLERVRQNLRAVESIAQTMRALGIEPDPSTVRQINLLRSIANLTPEQVQQVRTTDPSKN